MIRRPPRSPLFPSTPLFRSCQPIQSPQPHFVFSGLLAAAGAGDAGRRAALAAATTSCSLGRSNQPGGSSVRRLRERSEEHTSELQSLAYLVCRLLLEKKKSQ